MGLGPLGVSADASGFAKQQLKYQFVLCLQAQTSCGKIWLENEFIHCAALSSLPYQVVY